MKFINSRKDLKLRLNEIKIDDQRDELMTSHSIFASNKISLLENQFALFRVYDSRVLKPNSS